MGRRPLAPPDLAGHLAWVRVAIHDRHADVRLILEALLDAVEAVAGVTPPRATGPAPPVPPEGPTLQ
jgi:hypothetical protein